MNTMKTIVLAFSAVLASCLPVFSATASAAEASLKALDNGTIVDSATHLIWAQSDSGTDSSYIEALLFAESATLASFSDWRLPTRKELAGLLREQPNRSGLRISPLFQLESIFLYTSETKRCKAAYADLTNGSFNWVTQSRPDFGRVLLVRNHTTSPHPQSH